MNPDATKELTEEEKEIPEAVLDAEYNYFFAKKWPEFSGDDVKNPLYKLQIHNNTPFKPGFFSSRAQCEFCSKTHSDNCGFDFEDHLKMKGVLEMIKSNRDFSVTVHWREKHVKANLKFFEQKPLEDAISTVPDQVQKFKMGSSGKLTLYDCLNFFTVDETLSGND